MTPKDAQVHGDLRVLEALHDENSGTQEERMAVIKRRAREALRRYLARVA